jgi:hypothetical protein
MTLRAECPVINQLRLDFGTFTCNILGSDFVDFYLRYVHRILSLAKWRMSVRANQRGANMLKGKAIPLQTWTGPEVSRR